MTHIVWCPPEWRPKARATLAGLLERHPARTIFLIPCPGERGEDRRPRRAEGLPAPGRLARGALGGDRAPAARRRRASPGLDRAAAARLRPAGLLPLARRARLGSVRARPRSSASPTGSSSTRRSGARSRRPTPRSPELFDSVAVSDIAFSRTLPWRRRLAELLAGDPGDREAAGRGPARRRASSSPAGSARG